MEAEKELPAQGVQKPPRWVGEKRFLGGFSVAPATMVEIPAVVGSSWHGRGAWARQSAAMSWAARRGIHGRACLEVAHGDNLLPLPDLEHEGVGPTAEDCVGAVKERVERGGTTLPRPAQMRWALRRSAGSSFGS